MMAAALGFEYRITVKPFRQEARETAKRPEEGRTGIARPYPALVTVGIADDTDPVVFENASCNNQSKVPQAE